DRARLGEITTCGPYVLSNTDFTNNDLRSGRGRRMFDNYYDETIRAANTIRSDSRSVVYSIGLGPDSQKPRDGKNPRFGGLVGPAEDPYQNPFDIIGVKEGFLLRVANARHTTLT